MKLLRKNRPHKVSKESYKHIVGDHGEDIQEYQSSSSYFRTFTNIKE